MESRSMLHSPNWLLFLPPKPPNYDPSADHPRSAILINSSLPSDAFSQIPITCLDITAITLATETISITIVNIYNPPNSDSSISELSLFLHSSLPITPLLCLGDFNKHNPLWAGPLEPGRTSCSDSECLLATLAAYHLDLRLPPGTPTFFSNAHKTWSTIDLVFSSEDLSDLITQCTTGDSHGSDHHSVETFIDLTLHRTTPHP
jgi:hypothetical protein